MRYHINFATRTYLDHRLLNRIGYAIIAILLLGVGWNVSRVSSNMGEQSRLNADIAGLQSKIGVKPGGPGEKEINSQKAHIRFYNEIIERKSTNWLNLLDVLENVTPAGIALTSLTPGKSLNEWKLEGNARTFKSVRQYLEKLETSKNISDVFLLSHSSMVSNDKSPGVKFLITCKVLYQ
jgi:type IV pilus assembly protein PilN